MKKLLILILVGLGSLITLPVNAGYSYYNGYYWNGSKAYSHYYQPGYYSGYHYYPGYYYYQYEPSVQYTPPAPTVPAYAPGWKEEIVKLAKQRDDLIAYQQAIAAIGLKGQVFGGSGVYAGAYSGVVQGNTAVGYSVQTVQQMYGDTNLNVLYQQLNRLAAQQSDNGKQAVSEFSSLVAQAGDNAGRVAEIIAKAQGAAAVLDKLNAAASSRTTTTITGSATAPATMPPAKDSKVLSQSDQEFLTTVGIPACATCHAGATIKGNFKIEDFPSGSPELKRKVYERILSEDPTKVMPPPSQKQLTVAQLKKFLNR